MRALPVLLAVVIAVRCQCPRVASRGHSPAPPSSRPPSIKPTGNDLNSVHDSRLSADNTNDLSATTIRTTFLFNNSKENADSFSDTVLEVIDEIKDRLAQMAKITIENVVIDCTWNSDERCEKYTLIGPYYLLVVEDRTKGTVIYSLDKKYNTKRSIIEVSILDALSRHSKRSLMNFCSSEAEREVGFIRELSNKDVIKKRSTSQNKKWPIPQVVMRSPTEVNLIETSILDYRSMNEPEDWSNLVMFDEISLKKAMNASDLFFVLGWNNGNSISQHAFYLWSKACKELSAKYPNVIFGAVACHKNAYLCSNDLDIDANSYHTIFAYQKGHQYASTNAMKDVNYYVQWAMMLINGPIFELKSEDEVRTARKGFLAPYDFELPAISIGIFGSNKSHGFNMFNRMGEMLKGRYFLAYHIREGAKDSLSTVRPSELKKRSDYGGDFELMSLFAFVTNSSFPTVINISRGFTTDVVLKQNRPLLVLIQSSANDLREYKRFCSRQSGIVGTVIDRGSTKNLHEIFNSIGNDQLENVNQSVLILFDSEKIFVWKSKSPLNEKEIEQFLTNRNQNGLVKTLKPNDVHPLRYLQLAHINEVFGHQDTVLLPEPILVKNFPPTHPIIDQEVGFEDGEDNEDEDDSYGGCPFMRAARRQKEEL